ncbi:MAG: hypothetical protein ABI377_06020 [Devosia sp.]
MKKLRVSSYFLTSALVAVLWPHAASAADLFIPQPTAEVAPQMVLPAVSGINGKLELDGGFIDAFSTNSSWDGDFKAAGSLSIPVGTTLGIQGDVMLQDSSPTGFVYGGAVHVFTRDPNNYLIGLTGGAFRTPQGTVSAIGPEAELYLGKFSIEAWAGVDNLTYDSSLLNGETTAFGFIDGVYYLTDDFRLSLGASSVLNNNAFHVAGEYQFQGLGFPLSVTADARLGNQASIFTVGLKGYFGDPDKSLIDRQRQDDPRNRALDLFDAAGSAPYATPPTNTTPTCPDPEIWNGESCVFPG